MCKVLTLPSSVYYYKSTKKEMTREVEDKVVEVFNENRKVYRTRKIKEKLKKKEMKVFFRRIDRITKEK